MMPEGTFTKRGEDAYRHSLSGTGDAYRHSVVKVTDFRLSLFPPIFFRDTAFPTSLVISYFLVRYRISNIGLEKFTCH